MTPDAIGHDLVRKTPLLRVDQRIDEAVRELVACGLPALPVVDADGGLAGIFGEREFMNALFPGYLNELSYAGFVRGTLDEAIEKRLACRAERVGDHVNTEHIEVTTEFSDTQLAETFMHHRVLIIPVVGSEGIAGIITRSDFFRRLGERFLD